MEFSSPLLVEPLKNLVLGNTSETSLIATLSDRIRLFCTVYDPADGKYRMDYSIFLGSIIAFDICCLFWIFLAEGMAIESSCSDRKSSPDSNLNAVIQDSG